VRKILLPRKAITSIAIISTIVVMLAGGAVIGTLVTINNQSPNAEYISYEEAIEIANSIPEIAQFIEENNINSVSANIVDDIWQIEFFAENFTYTGSNYYWINYAYVEIDAYTGEVLYYFAMSPQEPTLTESEVMDIAYDDEDLSEWLYLYWFATLTVWYDGYQLWHVNFVHEYTGSYAHIFISDLNGSVVYFETYSLWINSTHSSEEIMDIVEVHPDVIAWKVLNPDSTYVIGFSKDGLWHVQYWDDIHLDFLNVHVNDTTLEVVYIYARQEEPEMLESDVITLAMSIPEIADYLATIPYNIDTDWYDNVGWWYIEFRHQYIRYEYAQVIINDHTGEIISFVIFDIPDPTMLPEDVWPIFFSIEEIYNWSLLLIDNHTSIHYLEGVWHASLIAGNLTLTSGVLDTIIAYHVIIDDITGEVLDISTWEYCIAAQGKENVIM